MSRVLWISDGGVPTGFGRVTKEIGERLVVAGHDVHVLANGYNGKLPSDTTLKLYSADPEGRGTIGYHRMVEMLARVEPDVVITLEDIPQLTKRLLENPWDEEQALLRGPWPIISYVPIDGYKLPPAWLKLKELVNVVPMSRFGAELLDIPGWIYHGVDPAYHPITREQPVVTTAGVMTSKAGCREAFGIPQDAFVIGRVDTNSGRKDWASTWKVIDTALKYGMDANSISAFHTKTTAFDSGVDLNAMVSKGDGKYLITNATDWPTEDVVAFVNCFDVTLSTSRGEGFGMGLTESLACGVPVLATDCSSITEVVGPGGVLVEGTAEITNPYGVDLVLSDIEAMAVQLVMLSRNPERRRELGEAGRQHVIDTFDWNRAATQFHTTIAAVLSAKTEAAP